RRGTRGSRRSERERRAATRRPQRARRRAAGPSRSAVPHVPRGLRSAACSPDPPPTRAAGDVLDDDAGTRELVANRVGLGELPRLPQRIPACDERLDLRLIGTRGTARRAALEPGPRRALEEPEERRARTKRARERALLGRALGAVRRARDREQLRDR